MWKLYGVQISVSIMLWLLPVKSGKMCFLSRSINTYITFSISPVCQQSLKYVLSGPLRRKLVDPCLEAFILHLNPRHSEVLSNLSAAIPPRDLICAEILQERCSIYRKGWGLGTESTEGSVWASVRMGMTQTEVRCIDIKLTVEGSSSPVPSVMRCDPDMMRPCVQSQFSPHSTQHCLFHCRLPFITEQ